LIYPTVIYNIHQNIKKQNKSMFQQTKWVFVILALVVMICGIYMVWKTPDSLRVVNLITVCALCGVLLAHLFGGTISTPQTTTTCLPMSPYPLVSSCPRISHMNEYTGFINQAAQSVYLREKGQPDYTVQSNIPRPTMPPLDEPSVNRAIAQQLVQSTATPLWLRPKWESLLNTINDTIISYIIPTQRAYIQSSILPEAMQRVEALVSNSDCGVTSYANSWTPLTCQGPQCVLNIQSNTGGPVRRLHVNANVTMHKLSATKVNTNEYTPLTCNA
jgi:hypothetical protein